MVRWMDIAPKRWANSALLFLLLTMLVSVPVSAQPGAPSKPASPAATNPAPADFTDGGASTLGSDIPSWEDAFPSNGENLPSVGIWNILIALVLVLGIFWAIFRYVVKPLMRGAVLGQGVENLRIVASLPIAPTKSVQIIKMVDRILVVGLAEGGMNLLAEITDAAEVTEILSALDTKGPAKYHPFRKAFDTMLARKDQTGFEDKQKKFNTTLDSLKEKIQAMRDTSKGDD